MAQDNKQNQNGNQGQNQDPNIQSRLPETETPGPFEQVGKRGKKSSGGEKGSQGVQSGEQPIQLPKGGGAISSIGEKFQNNPFTGSGTLTVPVTISEGREDFTPQLQLSYSSGGGNGPFGTGWSMGVASITRKTDKGLPQYRDAEESDTFIMAGAEDLVPEMENDGNGNKIRKVYTSGNYSVYPYRPRIETDFSLIERWEDQNTGISHWQVVDRKNVTRVYGQSAQARVADPNDARKVFKWLLEEKYNAKGNLIRYFFKAEDDANVDKQEDENNNKRLPLHEKNRVKYQEAFNQKYLKRVKYGNSIPYDPNDSSFDNNVDWYFELVLDYGEHHSDNPQPQPDSTWPVRKDPFSSFKAGFEVRTYRLCHRVLMFHHIDDLSTNPYLVKATEFEYEESPTMALLKKVTHRAYDDSNNETFPPLTFDYTRPQRDDQLRTLDVDDLSELPDGVDGKRYRWTDLNGEGIQGILADTPQGWYYKANRGDEEYYDPLPKANPPEPTPWFDPIQPVANKPRPTQQGGKSRQLTDLDGDGKPELVVRDTHLSGYFKTNEAGYWVSFHPFENIPRVNYDDPNLRMIDLTNNGFPDLLITENHFYRWYPANDAISFENPLKHARYHDEEEGAALVFADQTETVKLLDMSGDGLMDLVRIRNGEVSYWPNLGYGKFGRKVSMDHAPYMDRPEQFDPNRVRTADIDGTGTTDILYIRQGEAVFWENHSGNEWSAEKPIHHFPAVNDHTTVSVTDLFGNGTSSLVWSSPLPAHKGYQLRYLMLAGRDKPYMIKEMNNNMGGIQKFRYVPSTRFYLKDKYEGRDWIGRLPFPTQVLERHETYNEVTGARFVTRYAYHHGFFDTHEREFRGFGMVEQWDGERYQHFSNDTMFYLGAANESEESHVPPVHTKTWFHTGTYKDHPDLAHQYSDEYFDGDPEAEMPEDKPLPQGLGADEMREACRALKGKLLRQEVYGDDQSDVADIPYTVKVKTYRVDKKQDKAKEAQHAVFHVPELHTVTRNYERVADDPRVQHRVVMAMDAYGNVTKSGQVTYPRRGTGHDNEQKTMLITVNNKTVINETGDETASDGFYRLGVPVEQWQYQLHGVDEPSGLFTKQGLNNEFNNATLVAYENVPDNPSSSKKRIFKHNRTYYYDEQASSELPLGEVASHGLPYRQYQKVFTTGFISDVFNDGGVTRVTNTMLTDDGGYVQLDSDWWAPAERATHDNSNFYLPTGSVDPFGNSTSIQYDSYGLMPTKVTDPENNVIESDNDYRVLAPWRMTDPNDNRTEVAFDTRGMVTARAERGKSSQSLGDTLSDPTEKVSYDLFNWQDNGLPNYTHRQMREEHGSSNSRWLEQYTYTGGLGEVVMRKRKVAPGDAVERDTDGDLVYETDNQLAMEHADPRWVGTGRTVYNNKGDIVKQYEPYFSSIPDYEDEDELVAYGVTPVFHYDAPGRMIQVDHPDGTFEKVAFDAWHEKRYDPNDTVKDSQWWENRGEPKTSDPEPSDPEERAAWLAVHHYDTPQQSKLDVRGRPFMQIDDNGSQGMYETTTKLDIAGNPLEIEDAKTRITTTNHFDMRDEQARTSNIDSGLRRILLDVMGEPIYRWDDRGYTFRHSYDLLRRPLAVFVDDGSGEKKVEETVYGEEQNQAYDNNLRGEVYAVRDQSGEKVIPVYDFKGNPLEEETQFAEDYTQLLDWNSGPTLESETFTQEMSYNALNLLWQKLWDSGNKRINITYDEGGFFQSSTTMYRYQDPNNPLLADMAINSVTYNARGQRKKIQYDNGSQTVYEYDPQTFRLTRLLTTRNSGLYL